jgi:hypothetical protein
LFDKRMARFVLCTIRRQHWIIASSGTAICKAFGTESNAVWTLIHGCSDMKLKCKNDTALACAERVEFYCVYDPSVYPIPADLSWNN